MCRDVVRRCAATRDGYAACSLASVRAAPTVTRRREGESALGLPRLASLVSSCNVVLPRFVRRTRPGMSIYVRSRVNAFDSRYGERAFIEGTMRARCTLARAGISGGCKMCGLFISFPPSLLTSFPVAPCSVFLSPPLFLFLSLSTLFSLFLRVIFSIYLFFSARPPPSRLFPPFVRLSSSLFSRFPHLYPLPLSPSFSLFFLSISSSILPPRPPLFFPFYMPLLAVVPFVSRLLSANGSSF